MVEGLEWIPRCRRGERNGAAAAAPERITVIGNLSMMTGVDRPASGLSHGSGAAQACSAAISFVV
jgi:hypothetical protein